MCFGVGVAHLLLTHTHTHTHAERLPPVLVDNKAVNKAASGKQKARKPAAGTSCVRCFVTVFWLVGLRWLLWSRWSVLVGVHLLGVVSDHSLTHAHSANAGVACAMRASTSKRRSEERSG